MKWYVRSNEVLDTELTPRGPAYGSSIDYMLHEIEFQLGPAIKRHGIKDMMIHAEFPSKETVHVFLLTHDQYLAWHDYIFPSFHHETFSGRTGSAILSFGYRIKKAKRAGVPYNELYEYLERITYGNPRSQYYNHDPEESGFPELGELIESCGNYKELYKAINQYNKDLDKFNKSTRGRYEEPYQGNYVFEDEYDISDYLESALNGDESEWGAISKAVDDIAKDIVAHVR